MKKSYAVFIQLVLLVFGAAASAANCADIKPIIFDEFKRAFYNENHGFDYFPDWCSSNINSLNKRFKTANLPLTEVEILYIFRRDENNGTLAVWPSQSRGWTGDGWSFHVVMNYQGLILDLDYLSAPTPVAIDIYFREMFNNGEGENEGLLIKAISARLFLTEYSGEFAQYPRSFVKAKTDSLYPPQELNEYLERYDSKACL